MLYWASIFFVLALASAALGFGGLSGDAADVGKVLCFLFITMFLVAFLFSLFRRP